MTEITREQIEELRGLAESAEMLRSYYLALLHCSIDPEKINNRRNSYNDAFRAYRAAADNALPALLDIAEKAICNLEQLKGGDANADLSATSGLQTSPDDTSPGRECEPAGASEIEELCKELESPVDERTVGSTTETCKLYNQLHLKAAALIRRLVAERDEARKKAEQNWNDCGAMHDALGRALHIVSLAEELCDAVDAEAEDIGTGKRNSLRILQEIGPRVDAARKQAEEVFNGWPRF